MDSHTGWFKMFRDELTDDIMGNMERLALLVHLRKRANFYETTITWKGKPRKLLPGQMILAVRELGAASGLSYRMVQRHLKYFEISKILTQEMSHHGRIITICNFGEKEKTKSELVTQDVTPMSHRCHTDVTPMSQQKELRTEELRTELTPPPTSSVTRQKNNDEEENEIFELLKIYGILFSTVPPKERLKFTAEYKLGHTKFADIKARIEDTAKNPYLRLFTDSINRVWYWPMALRDAAEWEAKAKGVFAEDDRRGIMQDETYFRNFAEEIKFDGNRKLDLPTFLAWQLPPKPRIGGHRG